MTRAMIKKTILVTLLALTTNAALANVPVVSLNADGGSTDDTSAATYADAPKLSSDERLAVLERQMANVNKQNSQTKVTNLQQQIDQLQGKLDELSHQNQALSDQMKQQYQDLNDRLNSLSANNAPAVKAPAALSDNVADSPDKTKLVTKPKAKAKANDDTMAVAITNATDTAASTANSDAETAAYQKGFNLLKKGDYVRAAPAFENFLKNFPNGPHAPNAHFWLGEIHLAQNQADAAASEYQRVINDFPSSDKVQMAVLKLGVAYHDQGDLCKAKTQFEKVIKQYPKSTAATMAKKALQDIPSPCSSARKTT